LSQLAAMGLDSSKRVLETSSSKVGVHVVQIGSSNRIARHFSAIAEHKSKKNTHTHNNKKKTTRTTSVRRKESRGRRNQNSSFLGTRTYSQENPSQPQIQKKTINNDVDHEKGQRLRRDEFFWSTTPFWVLWGACERESHTPGAAIVWLDGTKSLVCMVRLLRSYWGPGFDEACSPAHVLC